MSAENGQEVRSGGGEDDRASVQPNPGAEGNTVNAFEETQDTPDNLQSEHSASNTQVSEERHANTVRADGDGSGDAPRSEAVLDDSLGATENAILREFHYNRMAAMLHRLWHPDVATWYYPVDSSQLPGYDDVIKEKMSLSEVVRKVMNREYSDYNEFSRDVILMFSNTIKYLAGDKGHELYVLAAENLAIVRKMFVNERRKVVRAHKKIAGGRNPFVVSKKKNFNRLEDVAEIFIRRNREYVAAACRALINYFENEHEKVEQPTPFPEMPDLLNPESTVDETSVPEYVGKSKVAPRQKKKRKAKEAQSATKRASRSKGRVRSQPPDYQAVVPADSTQPLEYRDAPSEPRTRADELKRLAAAQRKKDLDPKSWTETLQRDLDALTNKLCVENNRKLPEFSDLVDSFVITERLLSTLFHLLYTNFMFSPGLVAPGKDEPEDRQGRGGDQEPDREPTSSIP